MDKIKTVKIKNEDGSVNQEAYHISADARNIDMTNGYNVQDTIGTIDVDSDGSIAEQLNNINDNIDNIEIDIKKKPYYFNTVTDMKNANLKVGDYVITLGYYGANDGGGAEYKIINDNILVNDNGSIHDLKNGLKAQLIIKNNINIKQFGAKGDGINDDTNAIQNAINYLRNQVIEKHDIAFEDVLLFPLGRYKILSQIKLSPLVKIKTIGQVIIESYVGLEASFLLAPTSDDLIMDGLIDSIQYQGALIDGSGGFLIEYKGPKNDTNVCLQIGTTVTGNLKLRVAHSFINNLSIINFNKGIIMSMLSNYCNSFKRLTISRCKIGFQFGISGLTQSNSGERISFEDCQFGNNACEIGFDFQGHGHFYFNNCSFDFMNCCFNDSSNYNDTSVICDNCHFEGLCNTTTDQNLGSKPFGLIFGYFRFGEFIFNNTIFAIQNKYKWFTLGDTENPNWFVKYQVQLNNVIVFSGGENNIEVPFRYLADDDILINAKITNINALQRYGKFIAPTLNIVKENSFNTMNIGEFAISHYNTEIGSNIINYIEDIQSTGEIINNTDGSKILKLKANGINPRLSITTDFIEANANNKIISGSWTKGFLVERIDVLYFDENKSQIGHSQSTATSNYEHDLTTPYNYPMLKSDFLPKNTKYIKIQYFWENTNTTHQFTIGDELLIGELMAHRA